VKVEARGFLKCAWSAAPHIPSVPPATVAMSTLGILIL
jgi:hypothetical protein